MAIFFTMRLAVAGQMVVVSWRIGIPYQDVPCISRHYPKNDVTVS
jgi:hypothetical protein